MRKLAGLICAAYAQDDVKAKKEGDDQRYA